MRASFSIRRFWGDERGAEMVEWALVTLILLIATSSVIIGLREMIVDALKSIFAALQEDPADAWTTGSVVAPPTPTP